MRPAIQNLEPSRIREVANAGIGRDDVLAFWFGESDEVTPDFVRQAAIDSLQRGETFYAHNLGLPALRSAISAYMGRLHGPVDMERIVVTSGGVNALMLAMQALLEAGDQLIKAVTLEHELAGAKVEREHFVAGIFNGDEMRIGDFPAAPEA